MSKTVTSSIDGDKSNPRREADVAGGIALMTADRVSSQTTMETLKISAPTLNLWCRRRMERGMDGLKKALASAAAAS